MQCCCGGETAATSFSAVVTTDSLRRGWVHINASSSCQLNAAQSVFTGEKKWTPFQRQGVEEGVSQKAVPGCSL